MGEVPDDVGRDSASGEFKKDWSSEQSTSFIGHERLAATLIATYQSNNCGTSPS